jgi:hypothetical protein
MSKNVKSKDMPMNTQSSCDSKFIDSVKEDIRQWANYNARSLQTGDWKKKITIVSQTISNNNTFTIITHKINQNLFLSLFIWLKCIAKHLIHL